MGKFYKNKATKYHPSYEIENNGKTWTNLELTDSPTNSGRYIKLTRNPNPKKSGSPAYLRKYVRKDKIGTKGELLKGYELSKYDKKVVDEYLKNHEKAKKNS